MYDLKRIGANIRYLRKAHGETQEELAFALGYIGKNGDLLGKNTISNYENGIREPEKAILSAIARHFMVTVEELIHHDYAGIQPFHFDNHVLLKKIDTVLPIISTEAALKNEAFCRAYELHKQFYECFKKEKLDNFDLFTECLEYYETAEQDDNCLLLCAGNTIALSYLFLLVLKIPSVLSMAPAPLLQIAKKDFEVRKILDNPDPDFEKEASQALSDILSSDEFQDEMSKYKCALKKSDLWCDLADYYLAL